MSYLLSYYILSFIVFPASARSRWPAPPAPGFRPASWPTTHWGRATSASPWTPPISSYRTGCTSTLPIQRSHPCPRKPASSGNLDILDNPYSAKIPSYKPWIGLPKSFFIWNHHQCTSYIFLIVMGLRPLEIFYCYSAGIDFRCQNLTSTVRFWRLKSIPVL